MAKWKWGVFIRILQLGNANSFIPLAKTPRRKDCCSSYLRLSRGHNTVLRLRGFASTHSFLSPRHQGAKIAVILIQGGLAEKYTSLRLRGFASANSFIPLAKTPRRKDISTSRSWRELPLRNFATSRENQIISLAGCSRQDARTPGFLIFQIMARITPSRLRGFARKSNHIPRRVLSPRRQDARIFHLPGHGENDYFATSRLREKSPRQQQNPLTSQ